MHLMDSSINHVTILHLLNSTSTFGNKYGIYPFNGPNNFVTEEWVLMWKYDAFLGTEFVEVIFNCQYFDFSSF